MIKKLRRRIVLINMLLIGAVILAIFITVIVNNYTNSVNMMERGMNQVFDKNGREFFEKNEPKPEDFKNFSEQNGKSTDGQTSADEADSNDARNSSPNDEKKFEKRSFGEETPIQISSYIIVDVDENGNIIKTTSNDFSIDYETLNECVEKALSSKSKFGQLSDYGLMYSKRDDLPQSRIVLASNSTIFTSLGRSIIICSLLFLGSMAVIFVISLLLSGLAVKPVKKAWEQQKQFVADASHELKTPLTVILANNNIMMSHRDSTVKDEAQWLESTQEEAGHMKNLIDQMLYLAKSDAGTAAVQYSDVNFSEIVEGAALNFEPVAFEKEIMIDTEIEPDIVLNGNATELNQLVHILTDNAVKYADKETTVTIKLSKKNDRVEFSVNNFGNVISKEDMEHIFDRFYRAEKSRTTKGYGLGLSIAQRIVQSISGRLTVESTTENGTTFTAEMKI